VILLELCPIRATSRLNLLSVSECVQLTIPNGAGFSSCRPKLSVATLFRQQAELDQTQQNRSPPAPTLTDRNVSGVELVLGKLRHQTRGDVEQVLEISPVEIRLRTREGLKNGEISDDPAIHDIQTADQLTKLSQQI